MQVRQTTLGESWGQRELMGFKELRGIQHDRKTVVREGWQGCKIWWSILFQVQWKAMGGNLLVVQWLRLCAVSTGGLGLILGQGTRSHMPKILRVATKDPVCRNQDPVQPNKVNK